ncbi:MAG: hypothetical protein J5736_00785 [Bacilli bacterium]|nr:hypothetical protein [Bacilli bacterium]
MEQNSTKKKLPGKELAWYIVSGSIALIGLVFLIIGIIGSHYPGKESDNWVVESENAWLTNWSNMGYRWWGLILLGVGVLLGVVCLNVFARGGDRDEERALRRQQRIALEKQAQEEAQPEVVPVESQEVEPVKEEAKPEEPVKAEEPIQEEQPKEETLPEQPEEAKPAEPVQEEPKEPEPEEPAPEQPKEVEPEEPAPEQPQEAQPEEAAPEAKPEE